MDNTHSLAHEFFNYITGSIAPENSESFKI